MTKIPVVSEIKAVELFPNHFADFSTNSVSQFFKQQQKTLDEKSALEDIFIGSPGDR